MANTTDVLTPPPTRAADVHVFCDERNDMIQIVWNNSVLLHCISEKKIYVICLGQYSRPRTQFFPTRTDLGQQITCLLFSSVE